MISLVSTCGGVAVIFNDHTHTHPFNGPLSGTTWVSRYQKGKTNLEFTDARDSEWQWHQLRHIQVCTSLQADNHAGTPPLSFLQAVSCFSKIQIGFIFLVPADPDSTGQWICVFCTVEMMIAIVTE